MTKEISQETFWETNIFAHKTEKAYGGLTMF